MMPATGTGARAWALRAMIAVAVVLMLVPYFRAGFFFDDIYNSLVRGQLLSRGQSLAQLVGDLLHTWVLENGRFFPLSILTAYPLWDLADSLSKARLLQCALALADIWLFHLVVRRLAGGRAAILAVLMLPLLVQFNPRWDGLTSFSPLNQLVLLFSLLGWLAAIRACETGSQRQVALSAVAVTLGLLTYEIGVVGWIGAVAIAWAHRGSAPLAAKRLLTAQAVAGCVYFALYAAFRVQGGAGYDGVQSGSAGGMAATFLAQFFSAFPFAYLANAVLPPAAKQPSVAILLGPFLCFTAAWLLALNDRTVPQVRKTRAGIAWLLAATLAALPALLVSVSAKYQQIVRYGDPYIVVYLQYFGVALLLALALEQLWKRLPRWWLAALLAIPLGAIAAVTAVANFQRIEVKNGDFRWPRERMENLLHAGLLDRVPSHALLLVQSPFMWETETEDGDAAGTGLCAAFFSQHARKPLRCAGLDTYLRNASAGELAKTGAALPGVFIVRRLPAEDRQAAVEVLGNGVRVHGTVNRAGHARITSVPSRPPVVVALGSGFYGWEPQGAQEFAWSAGDAQLVVFSVSPVPEHRRIELGLQSALGQRLQVASGSGPLFDEPMKEGVARQVQADLLLQPGRNVLRLTPSGTAIRLSAGDPRTFSFRVLQPKVE